MPTRFDALRRSPIVTFGTATGLWLVVDLAFFPPVTVTNLLSAAVCGLVVAVVVRRL